MQTTLYDILERPELSKTGLFVSKFIILNILVNIFVVIGLEFLPLEEATYRLFSIINEINVFLFIIELLLRYIAVGVDDRYRGILGRIKYTFKPLTLIDIIAILPFFIVSSTMPYIRFLRFLRLFKLFRFRKYFYKLINFEIFITSNIFIQFAILFLVSIVIVFLFHFIYKETSLSLAIFLDPPALAETNNLKELIFGIVELIIGLIVGGTLISIITETIAQKADSVKNGFTRYRFKDHIIILHKNSKLEFILNELNQYYKSILYMQEIIIFLPNFDNINYFSNNLNSYSNLDIKVTTGDSYQWENFERISINSAKKMLILEDDCSNEVNKNIKISRFITSNKNFKNDSLEFVVDFKSNSENLRDIYDFCFKKRIYTIVSYQRVTEMFLNRSIANIDYFKIFSELLSFKGIKFYIISANDNIKENTSFEKFSMLLNHAVVIGIVNQEGYCLNPKKNTIINKNDKIIYIAEEKNDIFLLEDKSSQNIKQNINISIKKPKLKVDKKICVVGDFNDIDIKNINQFLSTYSIENITHLTKNEYMDKNLWQDIEKQNYDLIILNLEDEYELLLTLYLKNLFNANQIFLNKIVNILNSPRIAMLLEDQNDSSNIILSDKIVGQFITQTMMQKNIKNIYDEITSSFGSEFYVLTKQTYLELFELEYLQLKKALLQNDMIYIGTINKNKNFIFNNKELQNITKIVVLAEGVV